MNPEKMYSREVFEENEKKIDASRELARPPVFSGRADPGDIMAAKIRYLSGKDERSRLLSLAHEEALSENIQHSKEQKVVRVGDYDRIVLNTESGNKYIIQKNPSGQGYLVANMKEGVIELISSDKIENSQIKRGEVFYFGNGANTSAVTSGEVFFKR